MTRAQERRAQRALGTAIDIVADSRWIIWCQQPEHLPAMIDMLIAQGTLSESDRPHCVHWSAVRNPGHQSQEEIGKMVDADDMLGKDGIRTVMAEGWEAYLQGPDALKDCYQRLFGELDSDSLKALAELELAAEKSRIREWDAASRLYDAGSSDTP